MPDLLHHQSSQHQADPSDLENTHYDIIIIGGGITGAGIARDAALRGLKVILFEQNDFASGTSSQTSKLLHGGIRYLENLEFKMVFQSLRERQTLKNLTPSSAKELEALFPYYHDSIIANFKIGLGLTLYDLLATYHNTSLHSRIDQNEIKNEEPLIYRDDLAGAWTSHEYLVDDARLVITVLLSAQKHGAKIFPHHKVENFIRDNHRVIGVKVRSKSDSQLLSVKGKMIVSAAGPFTDHLIKLYDPLSADQLVLSKGIHLIFSKQRFPLSRLCIFFLKQKHLLAVPWKEVVLVGPTDTEYHKSTDNPKSDQNDIDYLLSGVQECFPAARLTRNDIQGIFVGLRPLVKSGSTSSYHLSREDKMLSIAPGFIAIAGGKLTTYRNMAEKIVDTVCEELVYNKECVTDTTPIYEEKLTSENLRDIAKSLKISENVLTKTHFDHGQNIQHIITLMKEFPELKEPFFEGFHHTCAEVIYSYHNEVAHHFGDVFSRRIRILPQISQTDTFFHKRLVHFLERFGKWTSTELDREIKSVHDEQKHFAFE